MTILKYIAIAVVGYLLGNISGGVLIARGFGVKDMGCNMHWAEVVFGIDAKVFGPLHLGWSVRYKRRLFHNSGDLGTTWYVPGFGTNDKDNLTANFNVIIDI